MVEEGTWCDLSFLIFYRFLVQRHILAVLENVPSPYEKNMYSIAVAKIF
jgi:hypothetical protein